MLRIDDSHWLGELQLSSNSNRKKYPPVIVTFVSDTTGIFFIIIIKNKYFSCYTYAGMYLDTDTILKQLNNVELRIKANERQVKKGQEAREFYVIPEYQKKVDMQNSSITFSISRIPKARETKYRVYKPFAFHFEAISDSIYD